MPLPQRIAAIPGYFPKDLKDAAPGHRFQLYLEHWQGSNGNPFDPYKKSRPQGKDERAVFDRECAGVLKDLCPLPLSSVEALKSICTRQQALHTHYGPNAYRISTTSTAPFATGLGNEHPIENGFAFLTPYGLPYLAGSGVKGILRRSMQELQHDGEDGFTSEAIDALFGLETVNQPNDAQRGALDFWDVFPNPAGGKLVVEIMTPHFGGYYQKDETPHDSGSPIPVSFLAVPAKSQFDFHVVCQPSRLPAALQAQWRKLLDRAFQHAFEWVGFGAKTSVGYGAMAAATAQNATHSEARIACKAGVSGVLIPSATASQIWATAKLTFKPNTGEIIASFEGKSTAALKNPQATELRTALGEQRANKLKKNQTLDGVSVEVVQLGNALQLKGLSPE
jgi:CRISPR-associated protein Cmr6